MRLLFLFLIISFGLCACGQTRKKYSVNPKAKQLNDSAISIIMYSQDYDKAFALLDKAIEIDSNYLTAFANKLSFQLDLKQFDEALLSAKSLIRIRPEDPLNFVTVGMIYDEKGDTISAQKYYNEAKIHFDKILDTMDKTNKDYDKLLTNKAVNLIFIGEYQKGNDILKQLYNKENNETYKELMTLYMNKTKKELLDDLFNPKEQVSSPINK